MGTPLYGLKSNLWFAAATSLLSEVQAHPVSIARPQMAVSPYNYRRHCNKIICSVSIDELN